MKKWLFLLLFFAVSAKAETLLIQTKNDLLVFKTDIADTVEKREKGLMFKQSIPVDYAMTFVLERPLLIAMWMKNTYIPLDMIFFDESGTVVHLIENARPHDLTPLSSKVKVKGVIELNAGLIKNNNIQIGDKISIKR